MDEYLRRLREAARTADVDSDSIMEAGLYIWTSGGWAMIVLALIAVFIFSLGFHVLFRLLRKRFGGISESTWRLWIFEPEAREGPVGEVFDRITRLTEDESVHVDEAFSEVTKGEVEPFARDLKLMKIAVGAAPLVGLLGTVTGMLATFNGLSAGGGGDKTMDMIAKGISEALYTTETGLVVALPGLFFHYYLSRKCDRYRYFLQHVETVWAQKAHEDHDQHVADLVHRVAREEVAARLKERLEPVAAQH